MKLKSLFYILLIVLMPLASCDSIDEADRWIYVEPKEAKRAVLIEDFTGQNCTNCPKAAAEIERLQELYGDSIIAVAIHSGPFAHDGGMKYGPLLPLATKAGDEFFLRWFKTTQPQPVVKINRGEKIEQRELYQSVVASEIEKETPLTLILNNSYDEVTRELTITVDAVSTEQVSGELEVWLTEDNIDDWQMSVTEGGSSSAIKIDHYEHNHVFRAYVTENIFGDSFNVSDEVATKTYKFTLDDSWIAENMAVVAFVSNATGVLQVVKTSVIGDKHISE